MILIALICLPVSAYLYARTKIDLSDKMIWGFLGIVVFIAIFIGLMLVASMIKNSADFARIVVLPGAGLSLLITYKVGPKEKKPTPTNQWLR
jgi:hypothetical protein